MPRKKRLLLKERWSDETKKPPMMRPVWRLRRVAYAVGRKVHYFLKHEANAERTMLAVLSLVCLVLLLNLARLNGGAERIGQWRMEGKIRERKGELPSVH